MSAAEQVDVVIVGAGVVGLACARALALAGRDVIVLEAADVIGSEISSRNSCVIHAGIYYPEDSNKARYCVRGKHLLYEFCASHGVEHERVGKILVATDDSQMASLEEYAAKGAANGVDDLEPMSPAAVHQREPVVHCVGALWSPSTGIIDVHDFMLALLGDAEANGAMVAFEAPALRGEVRSDGVRLEVGGAAPMTLDCRLLVNSAGLGAQSLARNFDGLAPEHVPPLYYAKGNYFFLTAKNPFRSLVYPMPVRGSLGVHVSFDLGRRCRFGPDIHWTDTIDYDVDVEQGDAFYGAIRRYWPGLPDGALSPDYTGIRPKLVPEGAPAADFVVQGPGDHGIAGLVNLFGIESPGLTSSMAIAERVAAIAAE